MHILYCFKLYFFAKLPNYLDILTMFAKLLSITLISLAKCFKLYLIIIALCILAKSLTTALTLLT